MESAGTHPSSLNPLLGFSNAPKERFAPTPPGGHLGNGILLLQDGEQNQKRTPNLQVEYDLLMFFLQVN